MSHITRKLAFCKCENKGADQVHSNCTADQRLCFPFIDSTFLHYLSEISSLWPSSMVVSDLIRNPKDRFSRDTAHIIALLAV